MVKEIFEQALSAAVPKAFRIELRDGKRIEIPARARFWIGTNMCHIGVFKGIWLDRTVSVRIEDVENIAPAKGKRRVPSRAGKRAAHRNGRSSDHG